MDYKGELLEFIRTLIVKDNYFRDELLSMIQNINENKVQEKSNTSEDSKNENLIAINSLLMQFKKDDLYDFLEEYKLFDNAKVNTKTTKAKMIDIASENLLNKYTLDTIKDLVQEYKNKERIDIFTEVIEDKEKLVITLHGMTVKELKKIIKRYKLLDDKNITKEKSKENIVEYIVSEAERQMKSATII